MKTTMDNLETGESTHLFSALPYDYAALEPHIDARMWEHAYYLKHENRRADYLHGWWSVVNWREAARRFEHSELSPERRCEDDGGLVPTVTK